MVAVARRRAARRPGLCARLSRRQARRGRRRFRRSDPLGRAAARRAGDGRLGALQARPAHRPYPGRRGAGHQRAAVEDRAGAGRRIFRRRRAPAAGTGRSSPSAISSRRSSASRAPIRRSSRTRALFSRSWRVGARRSRRCRCARRACRPISTICRWSAASAPRRKSSPSTDRVIGDLGHEALGLPRRPMPHASASSGRAGSVTLWQPFVAEATRTRARKAGSPRRRALMPGALARQIKAWLDAPFRIEQDRQAAPARGHLDPRPPPRRARRAARRPAPCARACRWRASTGCG